MKVEVAKTAGFCFGVRRAVNMVYSEAEENPDVQILSRPAPWGFNENGDLFRSPMLFK